MNKKVSLGHSGLKGWAEDGMPSTRQSQGLERWSVDKGNVPRNSVGANKYCKDIR